MYSFTYLNKEVEYSTYLIMVNPVHDIVVNAVRNMADMIITKLRALPSVIKI